MPGVLHIGRSIVVLISLQYDKHFKHKWVKSRKMIFSLKLCRGFIISPGISASIVGDLVQIERNVWRTIFGIWSLSSSCLHIPIWFCVCTEFTLVWWNLLINGWCRLLFIHRENSMGTIIVYMGSSNQCSCIGYALTHLIGSQNLLEV